MWRVILGIFLCLMTFQSQPARCEDRQQRLFSLAIGINNYGTTSSLTKAVDDAKAVDAWLKTQGFEGRFEQDTSLGELNASIDAFLDKIRDAVEQDTGSSQDGPPVAVFYYAGHGIEFHGDNRLIPAAFKFDPQDAAPLKSATVSVDTLMGRFGNLQAINSDLVVILIIDACRNNPYFTNAGEGAAVVSLVPVRPPKRMFVMYSAGIGQTALDGKGTNSVYTTELLKALGVGKPSLPSLPDLAQSLKFSVYSVAQEDQYKDKGGNRHEQTPAYYDQMLQPVSILGLPAQARKPPNKLTMFMPPAPYVQGDVIIECAQCPELVVVSPGSFDREEPSAGQAQKGKPVKIERMLAFGKFEVTNREWRACLDAGGCAGASRPTGADLLPVTGTSFDEANAYVEWLNRQKSGTPGRYRLPNEDEWEYAARGGMQTAYSFGDDAELLCQHANGADVRVASLFYTYDCDDKIGREPAQVGSYKPNAFGLHDVHGNVWEWVDGCADAGIGGGADGCVLRIVRGGSWRSNAYRLRSASRKLVLHDQARPTIGFRVVRELE